MATKMDGKGQKPDMDDDDEERQVDRWEQLPADIIAFVDGRPMTVLMTVMTIAALWGDDFRLATFDKSADFWFTALFSFAFFLFVFEFLANTVAKEDYKGSFFFYLDLVAALSVITDLTWMMDLLSDAVTRQANEEDETLASQGLSEARTARVVRLVRLIRLIRIVKLYSTLRKGEQRAQEAQLQAAARQATNQKQAALKRVEASRLGNVLSQKTTRRVVLMVLAMVVVTPQLTFYDQNVAKVMQLQHLFWFGRSNCKGWSEEGYKNILDCNANNMHDAWATREGWNFMIYELSQSHISPFHVDFMWFYPSKMLWVWVGILTEILIF